MAAHGQPAYELIQRARSVSAELSAIGSRGITGETRYLMGSVSDSVVMYVHCSVLVFRSTRPHERIGESPVERGR